MKNMKVEEVGFAAVLLDCNGNFVEGLRRGVDYAFESCCELSELVVMDKESDFDSAKEIFTEGYFGKFQIVKVKKFVSLELLK